MNMSPARSVRHLARFNLAFFAVATIWAPYFYVRARLFDSPTGLSVLLEWLALVAITGLLLLRQDLGSHWLRLPVAFLSTVFICRSVIDTHPSDEWSPYYWFGFGTPVLLVAVCVVFLAIVVMCWRHKLANASRCRLDQGLKYLFCALGWSVNVWAVPSLLQPMESWINMGDSTEKVLDEVAGWAVGNIPGVHSSWVANSFLGLPLAPLSVFAGFGEAKITIVVLYVNFLILVIPLCICWMIRQSNPSLGYPASFAIAIVSVTISGPQWNTSLFQELSFLARGLLPLTVAALTVRILTKSLHPSRFQVLILSVGASITFWNNFEYGFGALVAVVAVIVTLSQDMKSAVRQIGHTALGFAVTTLIVIAPGVVLGGNWLGRRLGVFGDVIAGSGALHSYSRSDIPEFGLPTLCFALGVVGVTLGFHELRSKNAGKSSRAAAVGSLYIGVWTVMSAPYFLNSGGSGAFRSQFLNIQVVLLTFLSLGILVPEILKTFQSVVLLRRNLRPSISNTFAALPILLLCSVALGSVVQVPNGVREWRRVQIPSSRPVPVDEWSPYRLGTIRPSLIPELIEPFGGARAVGWWFSYGNAVEALTGVENLLGTTGFEATRTSSQLSLACEPLIRSHKRYVISIASGQTLMSECPGISATAQKGPNDNGLIVFELARVAKSATN